MMNSSEIEWVVSEILDHPLVSPASMERIRKRFPVGTVIITNQLREYAKDWKTPSNIFDVVQYEAK